MRGLVFELEVSPWLDGLVLLLRRDGWAICPSAVLGRVKQNLKGAKLGGVH